MADDAAPPRRRRWTFRVAAVAGALVLALAGLEIALRVHHAGAGTYEVSEEALRARRDSPWIASDDPELVYVHRPGKVAGGELKIEAHGILRPQDVVTPKPEGVRRVAVLGDSVGAALYLEHAARFPARLERRLSVGRPHPTEVLNLCVNGYDTRQEARLLETVVPGLEPDAVLVVYCINDPAESVTPIGWFRDPVAPASYALRFLAERLGEDRGRPLAPGEGPTGRARPYWERAYDPAGPGWAAVTEGLDRIAAWRDAHDVPVLVAIAPLLMTEDPAGTSTVAFREQVAAALTARDLPFVDLQPMVTAAALPQLLHEPHDIYHFGPTGHAMLSDALYPRLVTLLAERR